MFRAKRQINQQGAKDLVIWSRLAENGSSDKPIRKETLLVAKTPFYTDLAGFFHRIDSPPSATSKNCANLAKKLLPLTDLTIIITSLVVRINGCQN
jgi:hypothetical protein